jgi:hypothetical protein
MVLANLDELLDPASQPVFVIVLIKDTGIALVPHQDEGTGPIVSGSRPGTLNPRHQGTMTVAFRLLEIAVATVLRNLGVDTFKLFDQIGYVPWSSILHRVDNLL